MKLKVEKRAGIKKSESKAIRRTGDIPAVVYIRGKESEAIAVNGAEFNTLMRKVPSGHLPTTVFELVEKGIHTRKAILKDIQYDPVTYDIIHLDFEELLDKVEVNVKVPIELTGIADCVGTKQGGVVRPVIRHLRVRCLPKDIPSSFQLDVRELNLFEVKRLSDLDLPPSVRPYGDLHEVAVTIAKR
jgi:large subunit ribosomal protein L25